MFVGQLAYTKTKAIVTNFLNWLLIAAKKIIPKNPEKIPKDPGMKILGKSRPKKSRDPGILQKSCPENPGIKIPENAGACSSRDDPGIKVKILHFEKDEQFSCS